jgi:hypothetical protein
MIPQKVKTYPKQIVLTMGGVVPRSIRCWYNFGDRSEPNFFFYSQFFWNPPPRYSLTFRPPHFLCLNETWNFVSLFDYVWSKRGLKNFTHPAYHGLGAGTLFWVGGGPKRWGPKIISGGPHWCVSEATPSPSPSPQACWSNHPWKKSNIYYGSIIKLTHIIPIHI